MADAIGQVLPFAVGVALSPMAVIAVVLMLSAPSGRANGVAFVAAWALGLTVVSAVVVLMADAAEAGDEGAADWVGIAKLALGAFLLLVAARQWRRRPSGDEQQELPAWMRSIEAFTPSRAAGLAILLACVKPKNVLLCVAAALALAQADASAGAQAAALGVFVLVATLAPGIPLAISLLMGDRAGQILGRLRDWMVRENDAIIAVLCLVIAAKLVGDALISIAG